jgi:hypothetical protein
MSQLGGERAFLRDAAYAREALNRKLRATRSLTFWLPACGVAMANVFDILLFGLKIRCLDHLVTDSDKLHEVFVTLM